MFKTPLKVSAYWENKRPYNPLFDKDKQYLHGFYTIILVCQLFMHKFVGREFHEWGPLSLTCQ